MLVTDVYLFFVRVDLLCMELELELVGLGWAMDQALFDQLVEEVRLSKELTAEVRRLLSVEESMSQGDDVPPPTPPPTERS